MFDKEMDVFTSNPFERIPKTIWRAIPNGPIEISGYTTQFKDDDGNPVFSDYIGIGDLSIVMKEKKDRREAVMKFHFPRQDLSSKYTPKYLQRLFLQEAEILDKVENPGLPVFYGIGEFQITSETKIPVIIREYFPGSIEEQFGGESAVQRTRSMVKQISSVLAHLYDEHGVLATDIDPSNIFYRKDGTYALGDLNLAFVRGQDSLVGVSDMFSAPELNKIGITEEEKKASASQQTQVYGLAMSAYCMLGGEAGQADLMLGSGGIKPINGVSESVIKILKKATSKNPNDRFPAPNEFSEALTKVLGE